MDKLIELLPFLIPLIMLQLGLQIYSIIDLVKRKKVRFDNKIVWGCIIILFNILGAVVYLVLGRQEE